MSNAIAIIGMAGRFPGAPDLAAFWRNLRDGVESVVSFSDEELAAAGLEERLLRDPTYVKRRAPLEDVAMFDAAFFGYSPKEAAVMDPQHRLFLECAWQALEHAAYDPSRTDGLVGVFAGATSSRYLLRLLRNPRLAATVGSMEAQIGNDKDYLATRVSYKLDLRGPSLTVQTGCSTSLVAVHLACQSLLDFACDLALAGGVSATPDQKSGYFYRPGGIASPDGHCRAFDAEAAGTVGGSGVGVVALKRLDEALADGDRVHAVVRGTAVNNDGSAKVGYTAPSVDGQAAVIAMAQAVADVDPATVSYVEAHGTGTALGDPIEVAALQRAFGASSGDGGGARHACALGSVKSNIGHLDAAAGVAGLLKTVLALQHRQIPPSLHYRRPNPKIDFDGGPFHVAAELTAWQSNGAPRRAGVSSFGIGGTNAHLVLEEAPPAPSRRAEDAPAGPQLLVLSARTPAALEAAGARLAEHLRGAAATELDAAELDAAYLADAAWTLQVGRRAFAHRRAVVAPGFDAEVASGAGAADRVEALSAALAGRRGGPSDLRRADGRAEGAAPPVVFLFPGQGAQHPGMARDLYERDAAAGGGVFRRQLDRCAAVLGPLLGRDLTGLLFPPPAEEDAAADELRQTALAQPALFAVEYALACLWRSRGVEPRALLGHSIGEWVAACLAGVFALDDALALVAARGRLMGELPGGAMLAVSLGEEEVAARLGAGVSLAAVNAADATVVSGSADAVAAFAAALAADGVEVRPLHTSHAFHSPAMEGMAAPFRERLRSVELHPPRLPFVSDVSGTWIRAAEATDPEYWVRQALSPVRFAAGLDTLLEDASCLLLEVGPGTSLTTLARRRLGREGAPRAVATLDHPRRRGDDRGAFLAALGALWCRGVEVDWTALHAPAGTAGTGTASAGRRRVPLPTYPFERRRHWIDVDAAAAPQRRRGAAESVYLPSWKRTSRLALSAESMAALAAESWLLLADDRGLGDELARRLRDAGAAVVTVHAGDELHAGDVLLGGDELQGGDGDGTAWRLDPQRPEHWRDLLAALAAGGAAPRRVVHLWGVGESRGADFAARFADAQRRGLYSLLRLVQAAGQAAVGEITLTVVADGVHDVTGGAAAGEAAAPEKATALAVCRVLPQEHLGVVCRYLDVALPASDAKPAGDLLAPLAEAVLAELAAATEPLVALRGGHRWTEIFEPLPLPRATAAPRLRAGGVYLLTGGFGKVGLTLAAHLARRVAELGGGGARLALLGRTPLPPRERWDEIAAGSGRAATRVRRLRELEELGAEVLPLAGDVAERGDVERALAAVEERFGALHGVVHAAGVASADAVRPLVDTAPGDCEVHFRAKVHGSRVLAELLAGRRDLDWVLAASSLAAVLGGLHFAAYAAANLFLDAFAESRRRAGEPWWTVDWDAWRFAAAGTGAGGDGSTDKGGPLAEMAMSADEALAVLDRVLAPDALAAGSRFVVSASDLEARIERWLRRPAGAAAAGDEAAREGEEKGAGGERPYLESDFQAPRNAVEERVAAIWEELLGIAGIGVHDDFFALGGHSLVGLHLMARLRAEAGAGELQLNDLFAEPTVAGLARRIAELGGGGGAGRAAGADDEALPECLVVFQRGGSGRPFFCVHPIGGHVFRFQKLARHLGDERPFWGLQARGLAELVEEGEHHGSIAEMAAEYLAAVRRVQPQGPYLLGGWSFGGFVAYEMAQQALAGGHQVALLTVIDAPSPGNFRKLGEVDDAVLLLELARQRGRKAGHDALVSDEIFDTLDDDGRFAYVLERLREAELVPADLGVSWLRHYIRGYRGREQAGRDYRPQPYPGRLTLLRARDIDPAALARLTKHGIDFQDPTFGWGELAASVDVVEIPGFHETIVQEPNVQELAARLRESLRSADQESP